MDISTCMWKFQHFFNGRLFCVHIFMHAAFTCGIIILYNVITKTEVFLIEINIL